MSTGFATEPQEVPPADDPYRIGWRDVLRTLPDGRTKLEQVPLTLENFLHPQEGDHFAESDRHHEICRYLSNVFTAQVAGDLEAKILSNVGIFWEDPELGYNAPDIAVLFGVKDPRRVRPTFHCAEEETRPELVLELTSPSTRTVDLTEKFETYHQANIRFYVLIDRRKDGEGWTLTGYQRTQGSTRRWRSTSAAGSGWNRSMCGWR